MNTIERLYTAFAALDPQGMERCYREDVTFKDEVFTLAGRTPTMGMWRMLIDGVQARSRDVWSLRFGDVQLSGGEGRARWEATYRFGPDGRLVHNTIEASFELDDQGLIRRHVDRFDFWAWSRQALGVTGTLLGWTPFLRARVRASAGKALERALAGRPGRR